MHPYFKLSEASDQNFKLYHLFTYQNLLYHIFLLKMHAFLKQ